jgi:hypothetical protein
VGPCVLAKSTVRELTETLRQEYEALRTRELSQEAVASPVKVGIFHDFAGSAVIGAASGVSHG